MKFYNRENELKLLDDILNLSKENSKMTVLTGRRRVGKTFLSINFARNHKYIYFFVSKKSESLLCIEYLEEIKKVFEIPVIGEIRQFSQIMRLLFQISEHENFTLIIDEFQEFYNINSSIYSEIQNIWDLNKSKTKMNLIFIGSIFSLMTRIFQNFKEPLFGRADKIINLQPFSVAGIKEILKDKGRYSKETLFNFYLFTGGIPRYIDILMENNAFESDQIIDLIFQENSLFINEGKNILIEEFGRDYTTYFSILELIAAGKTSRPEIESVLEKNTGGFIEKLEKDFGILSKFKPINAKENSRLVKYKIEDNFLSFWFRFIHKNKSAVEIENFDYLKEVVKRDYSTFAGRVLEKFYKEIFILSKRFNTVGSYWERGHKNEIDLICVNDLDKKVYIAEIKMNKKKIEMSRLYKKATRLISFYNGYEIEFDGLGFEDIDRFI